MYQNNEGFWYPSIQEEKCVRCGVCTKTCPVKTKQKRFGLESTSFYALYSLDQSFCFKVSSGNAFGIIAKQWLQRENGVVYGSAFDKDCYSASCRNHEDVGLESLQKSKYFESYLGDSINRIRKNLTDGKNVLFCGTPCQVDGGRAVFGKRENLILIDFICYGVPSAKWYEKYIKSLEKKNNSKAVGVDFRSKYLGWRPHCIKVVFENGKQYIKSSLADPYLQDFSHN